MPNLRGKTWTPTTPAHDTDAQFWEDHLISDADAAKISSSVQTVNGTSPDAQGNVDIVALPDGGTIGQVLTKQSSVDGDADWEDPASSGHTIQDEHSIDMPYQDTLQFINAEVTNDAVNEKTVVDCKGAKGDAATITVGTVTTLPAGSQATVNNSGTSGAAVFDFGIPKGADGGSIVVWNQIQGSTGATKIAEIDIDGTPTDVYAPTGGGGGGGAVDSVNGQTGIVTLGVSDLDDVSISSLASQQTIVYDGTEWGNEALADVALSGSYNDLSDKPSIPAAQVNADWNANSGVAQILNKPTIPTITDTYSGTSSDGMSGKAVKSAIDALDKSDSAVSGQYVSAVSEANGIITVTRASLPTIPTVNNGQLTIQQNGTNKATFTANQSGNATANIVTDDWVATGTVSGGAVSFSGIDDSGNYGYKPFAEVTASSTNKNPSAQISTLSGTGTSSMSVTYTTDADNGTTVKLRRIK